MNKVLETFGRWLKHQVVTGVHNHEEGQRTQDYCQGCEDDWWWANR